MHKPSSLISAPISRRSFSRLIAGSALAAPLIGTRAFGQDAGVFKIGYIGPQSGPLGIFGMADQYLIDTIRANLAGGIEVGGKMMQVEIITADTQSDPVRASQITRIEAVKAARRETGGAPGSRRH